MQTLLSTGLPSWCELALWWYVSHILVVIAELFCSRMCLLSFSLLSQLLKSIALVVVGNSEVGVEADGLVISGEGLLVPLELIEGIALVVVDNSVVGVEADGLVISGEGLLVPLELMEGIALVVVDNSVVGVE